MATTTTTAVALPTVKSVASGLQGLAQALRSAPDNAARLILIDRAHVYDDMCSVALAEFASFATEADAAESLAFLDAVKELRSKIAVFECDAERDIVLTPRGEVSEGPPVEAKQRTRVSRLRTSYEALGEAGGTSLDQVADAVRFRVESERSTSPRVRRAMLREGAQDEDIVIVNDVDDGAPNAEAPPAADDVPVEGAPANGEAKPKRESKALTFGVARKALGEFLDEFTAARVATLREAADAFIDESYGVSDDTPIEDDEIVDAIKAMAALTSRSANGVGGGPTAVFASYVRNAVEAAEAKLVDVDEFDEDEADAEAQVEAEIEAEAAESARARAARSLAALADDEA